MHPITRAGVRQLWALGTGALMGLLMACGGGGTVGTSQNPQGSAPVISSFSASPATISAGASSTLSWAVTGATSLSLDGGIGSVSGTSHTVSPASTTTYTLTATNTTVTVTRQATVTVNGADTQAPSVPAGLAASAVTPTGLTLTWNVSTDNVGVTGYRVFQGATQVGTPTATTFALTGLTASTPYSFTVQAVDAAGNASAASTALSVTTASAIPTPVIASFTATPDGIFPGQSVSLSWTVTGATTLSINQGVGSVTGMTSALVNPTGQITYTLTATNGGGSVTRTVTVNLLGGLMDESDQPFEIID